MGGVQKFKKKGELGGTSGETVPVPTGFGRPETRGTFKESKKKKRVWGGGGNPIVRGQTGKQGKELYPKVNQKAVENVGGGRIKKSRHQQTRPEKWKRGAKRKKRCANSYKKKKKTRNAKPCLKTSS